MWDVSEKPETRKNDQGIQDEGAENRLVANGNRTKSGVDHQQGLDQAK